VWIRIVVALVALAAIGIGFSPYRTHWYTVVRSGSHGRPVSLGPRPRLCAYLHRSDGVLRITGDATADTLANFPNFFQTAGPDEGVRMESAPNGTVGAAFHRRSGALAGLSIALPVEAHQAFTFTVDIGAGGTVTLQIENVTLTKAFTDLVVTCSQVLVGGGFDASRSLVGTVHRITFEAGTRIPTVPGAPFFPVGGTILLTWVLAGTIAGRPRRGDGDNPRGADD
jgi:hypothetical protein